MSGPAAFGFTDAISTVNAEKAKEIFDVIPQDADADGAVGADDDGVHGAGGAAGGSGQGGSGGPIPPNDTHWEIARTFISVFGRDWRYNVDAKRWFRFTGQIWVPCDTVLEALGEMMAGQADLILRTVNCSQGVLRARALKSMGTIASVRNLLQGHSSIIVTEADFDAQPHLLNTPAGVVDLRTGVISPHDPALLIGRSRASRQTTSQSAATSGA